MNSTPIFIDNYIGLIDNLESKYKLEIIERISKSLRNTKKRLTKKSTFGAFQSNKTAEELPSQSRSK